jgi:outer membrane protein OmpA-like peptidoglycan-associated protein
MRGQDRFIRLTIGPDTHPDCSFSPHFRFNDVEPLPQDQLALKEVADCLNRPDAQDYDVVLIGRADVRGSADYNARLGMERARRVRALLIAHGMDPSRVHISSRGEHEAKGFLSMYAHGYDRRVDLVIRRAPHAPSARASL